MESTYRLIGDGIHIQMVHCITAIPENPCFQTGELLLAGLSLVSTLVG